MATISELVAKHSKVPGDIKVRRSKWSSGEHFRPYFQDKANDWHGSTPDGDAICVSDPPFDDTWQLYTEPKPKVKRWLWATWTERDQKWCQETTWFMTDADATEYFKKLKFVKLPWSETEFEE